jgi:GxxExxY protein
MELGTRRDERTAAILGCAFEVQNALGCGFLETAYQDALAIEFDQKGVPYRREAIMPIQYKGTRLGTIWRSDFLVYESVIVELKAVSGLKDIHQAQVLHYLKASGYTVGLLLNFGLPRLEFKRIILSPQ